jgi:hypothetical protein
MAALLASCAAAPETGRSGLQSLHLFDKSNLPRFSFYFSCAGQVAAETELCWVPAKYFAQWAAERHISIRQLRDGEAFDAKLGVPATERGASDVALDYRILVRFRPVALPSYTSEVDGMGGYIAPKAGYEADLFVYSSARGELAAQTSLHAKSDAKFRGDAVPYVKAGVQAVLASLSPNPQSPAN